jgi:hypothetical protein
MPSNQLAQGLEAPLRVQLIAPERFAREGREPTHLLEILAIDGLLATNVKRGAEIPRITWNESWQRKEESLAAYLRRSRRRSANRLRRSAWTCGWLT